MWRDVKSPGSSSPEDMDWMEMSSHCSTSDRCIDNGQQGSPHMEKLQNSVQQKTSPSLLIAKLNICEPVTNCLRGNRSASSFPTTLPEFYSPNALSGRTARRTGGRSIRSPSCGTIPLSLDEDCSVMSPMLVRRVSEKLDRPVIDKTCSDFNRTRSSESASTGSKKSVQSISKKCVETTDSLNIAKQSSVGKQSLIVAAVFAVISLALIATIDQRTVSDVRCTRDIDMTSLEQDLATRVFGQHIAAELIQKSLKELLNSSLARNLLVLSFHGGTGIGKNYVSNIISSYFNRESVHRLIVPLHFPHSSSEEAVRLEQWIMSNVTSGCGGLQLFIIDEVDKAKGDVLLTLFTVIQKLKLLLQNDEQDLIAENVVAPLAVPRGDRSSASAADKVIVLLLSNAGASVINSVAVSAVQANKRLRESVTQTDVLLSMRESLPNEQLLDRKFVDFVIPFLPLERRHVVKCMETAARARGVSELKETIVNEVLSNLEFFPKDLQLFSVSGCRKIPSRLDLVLY